MKIAESVLADGQFVQKTLLEELHKAVQKGFCKFNLSYANIDQKRKKKQTNATLDLA